MEPKIMIVDDEPDFLESMGKFFLRRNIGFERAGCCDEALDLLGAGRFDVIIMDVKMPGKDGLACLAEMKKLVPELEVIVLTGHASLDAGLTGMQLGAFDYCLKPVEFSELLEKIALAREKAARAHVG
ncbi:MAG: response regulator [Desulfopila sp.]